MFGVYCRDPGAGRNAPRHITLDEFKRRYPGIVNLAAARDQFPGVGLPFMVRFHPGDYPSRAQRLVMMRWCKANQGNHEWRELWNFATTPSGKEPGGQGVYAFLFTHEKFARNFHEQWGGKLASTSFEDLGRPVEEDV